MSGSRPLARRIIGVETEYGITCAPTTDGPPPMDADHAARELFDPVVQRSRSSNVFTRGGARLYLDVGSHPEFATAECDRLEDVLAQDRAGELVMADLAEQANARLAATGVPGRIHLLKNNRDAEGNGFGCHENYLVRRRGDFWNDARTLVPHLVTRQILVGAGHIAADGDTRRAAAGLRGYVFSQRADQMWDAVSSATTRARPLINTRDEPHADAERYRRMHVIVGDSNIAQGSTLLKVAAMDLLLDYLEHGGELGDLALADPMRAIRDTCHDMSGGVLLERSDGRTITPLEVQAEHLGRLRDHVAGHRGHRSPRSRTGSVGTRTPSPAPAAARARGQGAGLGGQAPAADPLLPAARHRSDRSPSEALGPGLPRRLSRPGTAAAAGGRWAPASIR